MIEYLNDELKIDECSIHKVNYKNIYDTLSLYNSGCEIDEDTLYDKLIKIDNLNKIKSFIVEPSSKITDVKMIKAFPYLENIFVYGYNIQSLDGLEYFKNGRFIEINTGKNKKRNIDEINNVNIKTISINGLTHEDADVISKNTTIKKILINNCPNIIFQKWKSVPIESIQLWGGTIDELSNLSHINSLNSLTLYGHKKLEKFTGDNSNIKWLIIQHCNLINISSINTFSNINYLTMQGIKQEIGISLFFKLKSLIDLSLLNCHIKLDNIDLKKNLVNLERITISGIKKEQLVNISKNNKDLIISNGKLEYINGNNSMM
jgi:hypothetical protein